MKCGYFPLLVSQAVFLIQLTIVMSRHAGHHRTDDSESCFRCPIGFGVVTKCSRHHDTECAPCESGFYSSHRSSHRPCYPCSRCGVGLYIAHHCTPTKDTVCDSCHTYKGPHNENFYKKCVLPLLSESAERTSNSAQIIDIKSKSLTKDESIPVPPIVLILGIVAASSLAAVVIAASVITIKKKHCTKVNSRYPYQAVATQEAVML